MARPGGSRHDPAHGLVRARRAAGGRGDDDPGALPVTLVSLYRAEACELCERALEVVLRVREEVGFELELVDVDGVPELEARYRELLPVVEVDGERAFTYFVDADALRRRVGGGE